MTTKQGELKAAFIAYKMDIVAAQAAYEYEVAKIEKRYKDNDQ